MARVSFESVFRRHPDGSLEPRQRLRIGGVTIGPGVRFSRGTAFGGVDLTLYVGNDLDIETDGNVAVIKGIYVGERATK